MRDRQTALTQALALSGLSVVLSVVLATIAVTQAIASGSVGLLGFGADAAIDGAASVALIWRFSIERRDPLRAAGVEAMAHRAVGVVLIAAAALIAFGAARALALGTPVEPSPTAVALLLASLLLLPPLALGKRRVSEELRSGALRADAFLTAAAAVLAGVGLLGFVGTTLLGATWADPLGALVIAAIMAREGRSSLSSVPQQR